MAALLPPDVVPVHYQLRLVPDLPTALAFTASLVVHVDVVNEVQQISLHSVGLTVTRAFLCQDNEVAELTWAYDEPAQQLLLKSDRVITPGRWHLGIEYHGPISTALCGVYRSAYVINGETKYMVVTQFEATDARRALPCWDEPALKASFSLTLVVPSHLTTLANTEVLSSFNINDEIVQVTFATTPIMSTYLLAFVIGQFDVVQGITTTGTKVRVFTPIGRGNQGMHALSVSLRALPFYEDYFQIPYPLSKLDLVAIPDFAAGAMENWGLVTFREVRLLVDSKSSLSHIVRTTRTLCHEISHMWFGNLCTMQWWTHLWLNEGFARFMEHIAVDHIYPEWNIWEQFCDNVYSLALSLDSSTGSHAVEVDVQHPDDINEIFDTVSYAKGASIVRMLRGFVGEHHFDTAVRTYLQRFKYRNAVTQDLWQCVSETVGMDISSIMHAWTRQAGYPIVTVSELQAEYVDEDEIMQNNAVIVIKQDDNHVVSVSYFSSLAECDRSEILRQRLFLVQQRPCIQRSHVPWQIPVRIVCGSGLVTSFLIKSRETLLALPSSSLSLSSPTSSWVKFNADQLGFYRVIYQPESLLSSLIFPIQHHIFNASDRLGFIGDLFAGAGMALLHESVPLSVLDAYVNEDNLPVWSELSANLRSLLYRASGQPYEQQLKLFIRQRAYQAYSKIGFSSSPSDGPNTATLRAVMVSLLLACDDPDVIATCVSLFNAQMTGQSGQSESADMRLLIYQTAVKYGGEKELDAVMNIYLNSTDGEERRQALQALCKTNDSQLIRRVLEFALSDHVRPSDVAFCLGTSSSGDAVDVTWQFFQEKFEVFQERYSTGQSFILTSVIESVTNGMRTRQDADKVEAFFSVNNMPSASRTIQSCIGRIRNISSRISRSRLALQQFLDLAVPPQ